MMPKLIDRTKFEKDIGEILKHCDDPVNLSEEDNDFIISTMITLGDQPIVDAIPVEWLANLSKQETLLGNWKLSSHIDKIIGMWRKENDSMINLEQEFNLIASVSGQSKLIKHGYWIDNDIDPEAWNFCSVCGEQAIDNYDYCPNCGAKMDKRKEE